MSEERHARIWDIVREPLLAWGGLVVLLASTIGLAYVPMAGLNIAVSLFIAGLKTAIIVLVFMELIKASGLHRFAAGVGVFWLMFLLVLSFSDYLSR